MTLTMDKNRVIYNVRCSNNPSDVQKVEREVVEEIIKEYLWNLVLTSFH